MATTTPTSDKPRSRPVTPRSGFRRNLRDSVHERRGNDLLEEMSRLLIDQDRAHEQRLALRDAEQKEHHTKALDHALSLHCMVCDSAKQALEFLYAEKERLRLEESARKSRILQAELQRKIDAGIEAARQQAAADKAAADLRQQELQREQEQNTRRAAEQKRREDEQTRLKAEQDKRTQQEADAKAKKEADAQAAQQRQAQQAQQAQTPAAAANSVSTPAQSSTTNGIPAALATGLFSTTEERESVHRSYLDLHQRLKQMRKEIENVLKQANMKNQVTDIRRKIGAHFGQITKHDTKKNTEVSKRICELLDQGVKLGGPTFDVSQCFANTSKASGQAPCIIIYLLNHFAKAAIRQMMTEAGRERVTANGIGVLIVSVFSDPRYQYNAVPFIDFLWAKYHVRCPVLFGINGDPSTPKGKRRIGWIEEVAERQKPNGDPIVDANGEPIMEKMFITTKDHLEFQGGLAVGFAACTLRNFSKSKKINPVPNRMYWEALARILSLPTAEQHVTHYEVLIALMDPSMMERFVLLYGEASLAVMRKAFIDFPRSAPETIKQRHPGHITTLTGRPAILDNKLHLAL